MTESIGPRPWPKWVSGPARIDGDEIVLEPNKARLYSAFEPEHLPELLTDLAALRDFKLQDPVDFARRHGLLWHGPDQVHKGECRESLRWWRAVGTYLTMTIHLSMALKQGLDEKSAGPVRAFLWAYRDARLFKDKIPDDTDELLEYASIQLAEMITRGLADCKETLVAACSLLRDGKKRGPAGDFRRVIEPSDLVGAAYKHLATVIVRKEEFRECKGCGRWFQPDHGRQWHHTKECGRNKRQRNFRARAAKS
jgi:hypothetical protein